MNKEEWLLIAISLAVALIVMLCSGCESMSMKTDYGKFRYARFMTDQNLSGFEYDRVEDAVSIRVNKSQNTVSEAGIKAVGESAKTAMGA